MLKKEYRTMPLDKLALELASQKVPDARHILQQVEGWQRLRTKVPTWTDIEGIEFPPRLALEQCSGEAAARYKRQVAERLFPNHTGKCMVDLTGGLGVDFSFIAPCFDQAIYVERQEELCQIASHNFPLLGLHNAQVVNADAVEYLHSMPSVDLIFIDPARRSQSGKKVVFIEDCEPNVCQLCHTLVMKARYVVVKLSTMLDITASVRSLNCVREVHVVSVGGECKDLLLVLDRQVDNKDKSPTYFIDEGGTNVMFEADKEENASVCYATKIEDYLYEPGAATMKAGAFKYVSQRYGLKKLHVNTHLYTSVSLVADFPGRCFKVLQTLGFNKKDLKQLATYGKKANLTVRNFPSSVESLRKKLHLKEGGSLFLFATTIADNQHVIIVCEKS